MLAPVRRRGVVGVTCTIRRHAPRLEVIAQSPAPHVSGIYMLVLPQQTFFFADCT